MFAQGRLNVLPRPVQETLLVFSLTWRHVVQGEEGWANQHRFTMWLVMFEEAFSAACSQCTHVQRGNHCFGLE